MSVDNFDPYFKWLGIAPKDQPPTHYRLLGIDPFTDDADVISNAADRQMMLIRTFQTGQHSQLSQRLLNEISTARTCLLDSRSKQDYDRNLRAQIGTPQFAPSARERTVATRPPQPGSPDAAAPMSVPMAAPNAGQPTTAPANNPPVLNEGPTAIPLAPMGHSPELQRTQALPTTRPLKRRRDDSSQMLFWVIGIGVGAVLLLVIMLLVSRMTSSPADPTPANGDAMAQDAGSRKSSGSSDLTGSAGSNDSATATTLTTSGDKTKPSGETIRWRAVGKRQWTFDNEDVHATKEMQPGSWLISREDYSDFVVTLEYVLERGGAGGVYLRVPSDASWPWNQGLEIHFTDDYLSGDIDHESTGAIWHRTPPSEIASRPPGQWNEVRIECRNRDVTVFINGKTVTRYHLKDDSVPSRGHLGLDGVSGGITYRNLRVERLD